MAIILASRLKASYKDANGERHAIALEDINYIITNIKKFVQNFDCVVFVANDPNNFEENDLRASNLFESFELTNLCFKNKIVLDNRNKENAKTIIENSNLIILTGGKIECQNEFFKSIKLKSLLKNHKGLTIGTSAGAMNLCKKVCNFPEEESEIGQALWVKGLGIFDGVFIPHFDGETKSYQIDCGNVDVANEYIIPASKTQEFIAVPDYSYILINGDEIKYFGLMYKIKNGKVIRFNALKGCVVEESLVDNRFINNLKVTKVHVSSDTNPTNRWHIYDVLVPKEQVSVIAKNLNLGKWYTHFWDEMGNITAVFSGGKTFNFNYYDKSTWKNAIKYGIKLGIPKEQLDFLII